MSGLLAKVLIADGDPRICRLLEEALGEHHIRCVCTQEGNQAERLLVENNFDVAILDLLLPGQTGLELLKLISRRRLDTKAICTAGSAATELAQLARQDGAFEFFEKPFDVSLMVQAVLRAVGEVDVAAGRPPSKPDPKFTEPSYPVTAAALENLQAYREALLNCVTRRSPDEAQRTLLELAGALVMAVELKDPYSRRHAEHVAFYADHIARHAGLASDLRQTIRLAGLLHDIGKIVVPDSILTKPGPLSQKEFALIRQHPRLGAGILEGASPMAAEARLVCQHHENWDGSGYPAGLTGSSILAGARVLNIADSMDAMLMHRAYKRGHAITDMMVELERCAGSQFDPALAHAAKQWCERNPAKLIQPDHTVQLEPV